MLEQFDVKECEKLLLNVKPDLEFSYSAILGKQSKDEKLPATKRHAYGLLAEACGMRLCPESRKSPIEPFYRFSDGQTSFTIDMFSEEDLEFFASIVSSFRIARLRARIADILWLRHFHDAYMFATQAVQAYLETPLSSENWKKEKLDQQWSRGCILAIQLGKGNEKFYGKTIHEYLIDQILKASPQDVHYLLFLVRLLARLKMPEEQKTPVFEALDHTAQAQHASGQFERERAVLEEAKRWTNDWPPLDSRIATSFEAEIQLLLPHLSEQYFRAQLLCTQLVNSLRGIPEKSRTEFRVEERLRKAQTFLVRCRTHSTENMRVVKSPPIDISDVVQQTVNAFHGLSMADALEKFARLSAGNPKSYRDEALARIQRHPISYIFPRDTLSSDGRVVSKSAGWNPNPRNEAENRQNDAVLEDAMMDMHRISIGLRVMSYLQPAYSVILEEHCVSFSDAVDIVRQSPLVPPNRIVAFARVLECGFHGDLFTAMYILSPEIENLIRFHLNGLGVKTTTVDEEGIEQEIGMTRLMKAPEVEYFLGKNHAWELNALFCAKNGPNLRNNYAHGIETEFWGNSDCAFYAWWLVFRMIMLLKEIE
jgi:hypothetical protein